ncbi:DNA-binding protein [Streptomyces sp. 21So2-11]|uniref:DNA-binding protein n=1 Tax=Streptomyces sp. 21So2-11 TaxID=3144408 RepID=UPI00321ACFDD
MDHSPKTLLKVLVTQRRWTAEKFIEQFDATAQRIIKKGTKNPTLSVSQFRRWTAGNLQGLPAAAACEVLREMFGVDAEALFGPPPSSTTQPAYNLEDEIAMTAQDAQDEAGAAAAQSISDTTLDQLRDDVLALARGYNNLSAFDVFRTGRALREKVERQRDRTQVPSQQQELLVLAGQTCAMLSTAAFDLGSLNGATRLARAAALYGETARFGPLQAFAGGTLAYIAYFTGQPSQAVNLAQRAQMFAGLGDQGRQRLLAIQARAFGHVGNTANALRAMQATEHDGAGERDVLHDEVGGEFGFSPERLAMSNGSTALLIGDGDLAEVSSKQALHLVQQRPAAQRSAPVIGGASADVALARLLREDLDGAAAALWALWEVPADQRVTGLLLRTERVRQSLVGGRFRGSPLATELAERCEDFAFQAPQHQLNTGAAGPLALEA